MTQLCQMFGITRQTLYRAMEAADAAAKEALAPKPPGRKKKPADETEVESLQQELTAKQKELARWQQKYEVLKTLRSLEQKLATGEPLPGEERKKRRRRK
jgi:transposase